METLVPNVMELYTEIPLKFLILGDKGVLPEKFSKNGNLGLFKALFGQYDGSMIRIGYAGIDNRKKSPDTCELGEEHGSNYFRRSLWDMFLLSKHYVADTKLSDLAKDSIKHLGSNQCYATGLRVYRPIGYYSGHLSNFTSDLWYNETSSSDHYDDDWAFCRSYEEVVGLICEADEIVRGRDDFSPVGRAFDPEFIKLYAAPIIKEVEKERSHESFFLT